MRRQSVDGAVGVYVYVKTFALSFLLMLLMHMT